MVVKSAESMHVLAGKTIGFEVCLVVVVHAAFFSDDRNNTFER